MKYYLYIDGDGGCDYTIACNKKLIRLEAKTREDAIQEAKDHLVGDEEGYYGDEVIEGAKISLLQVTKIEKLPVDDWIKQRNSHLQELKAEVDLKKKRETYEKLKKEFEGS